MEQMWILLTDLYEYQSIHVVAYFCHQLLENNVESSDLYVILSDLYDDLSDLNVDLSLIHLSENKS